MCQREPYQGRAGRKLRNVTPFLASFSRLGGLACICFKELTPCKPRKGRRCGPQPRTVWLRNSPAACHVSCSFVSFCSLLLGPWRAHLGRSSPREIPRGTGKPSLPGRAETGRCDTRADHSHRTQMWTRFLGEKTEPRWTQIIGSASKE